MDFLASALASSASRLSSKVSSASNSSSSNGETNGGPTGSGKRKAEEAATSAAGASSNGDQPPVKKFKTRGEIETERRAQEQKEKEERIKARQTAAAATAAAAPAHVPRDRKQEEEAATASAARSESDATDNMISAFEVKRRLRSYSEPITLFGESDLARFNRLKLFELHAHEKATSSHGRKNVFAELQQDVESEIHAAMMADLENARKMTEDATTDENTNTAASAAAGTSTQAAASDAATAAAAIASTDEIEYDETGKPLTKPSSASSKKDYRGKDLRRSDFDCAEDFILYFFKRMLAEWEAELDARPKEVRLSARGKIDSATQKQTRTFIKPLFKLLKTRTTSKDILKATEQIATCCLERRYAAAQEAYLTMAIGNAAWPMGVTMVSIHERAGRTKLNANSVAHVLNDETQRKYIQSAKRLMTFCEEHYPA